MTWAVLFAVLTYSAHTVSEWEGVVDSRYPLVCLADLTRFRVTVPECTYHMRVAAERMRQEGEAKPFNFARYQEACTCWKIWNEMHSLRTGWYCGLRANIAALDSIRVLLGDDDYGAGVLPGSIPER